MAKNYSRFPINHEHFASVNSAIMATARLELTHIDLSTYTYIWGDIHVFNEEEMSTQVKNNKIILTITI